MKYFKFAQRTYTKKDFEPKKLFRSPSVRGNGGKNKGKKYYTKEIDQLFHNMVYGILFFIVVVFITSVISTAHTKKFNEIMSSLDKVAVMDEFKTHVVKAEGVIIEYAEKDGKGVESTEDQIKRIGKIECEKRGFGESCVDDLLGMAFTETRFNCEAVGDNGKSYGCFQIHLGYHKEITKEQAKDLNFSIPWTLNRLIAKGYPTLRSVSIMMHNGTPNTPKTKAYLASINEYIKNN